jgi:TldD protein
MDRSVTTAAVTPGELFFTRSGLDQARIQTLVGDALRGADDGELFLEYRQSESFGFDDGRLKSASFDTTQGFGLRAVLGEHTGYAHASELSEAAIRRAVTSVRAVRSGHGGQFASPPPATNRHLYTDDNPLLETPFEQKVALLQAIDAYARGLDARVRQVSVSLASNWQAVAILRPNGQMIEDVRPLVRLNVSVVVQEGDRQEGGSHGAGGRVLYGQFFEPKSWQRQVNEALRQALTNLHSVPAPAGEMPVVLGPGWPGILLHEAIGHGLEGDFNRKKTSVFTGRVGSQIAAPGVTVVDDGTLASRRGSLSVDDEGTPSQCTVLIEDGVLKGYLQDRLNARLMGVQSTGNGRRESFAHKPMPRMTNTYMLPGAAANEDILAQVKKGIYAVNFGGGQVDITSGKFVFSCTEAYVIENGKIGAPIKGATLIGQGSEVLKNIKAVGNDLALDEGIGTCGKNGQGVPVGVGQPTLLIEGLTVGGTAA